MSTTRTVPGKVSTTRTEDGHKQNTKTSYENKIKNLIHCIQFLTSDMEARITLTYCFGSKDSTKPSGQY